MKTAQDFHENYNQFDANIEKEIMNLNRMREEMAMSGAVAQQLIIDLEPVLKKLHLTIGEFSMSRPNREEASNRGTLSLTLPTDGKFRFIQFRGYTSRGSGKNEDRLCEKANTIREKVMEALQTPENELRCSVNQYSLETRDDKETGRVLMAISYNF